MKLFDEQYKKLIDAECVFCRYNGIGYWQPDTHSADCPWHGIGGSSERLKLIPKLISLIDKDTLRSRVNILPDEDTVIVDQPTISALAIFSMTPCIAISEETGNLMQLWQCQTTRQNEWRPVITINETCKLLNLDPSLQETL